MRFRLAFGYCLLKNPLLRHQDLLKDNPRLKQSPPIQIMFCCCAFMVCYLADRRPHNISWDWRDKVGKDQHFFMGKERSCFSSKWQELRIEALLWLLFSIAIILLKGHKSLSGSPTSPVGEHVHANPSDTHKRAPPSPGLDFHLYHDIT